MPRITVKLPANYDAITRPVATSIARDMRTLCAIPDEVRMIVLGEFDTADQPGTHLGDNGEVRFESDSRTIITAEDKTRLSSILNQVVRGDNDLPPLWKDDHLGVYIRPVYVQSDLVLSVKYVAETRQQAINWRDEFAMRTAENRTAIQHEIFYHIPVKEGVLGMLAMIHQLREKQGGYGESFVEYFEAGCTKPWTGLGTVDGDIGKIQLAVPEKQAQLTGWFEFGDLPTERKADGNSTWEIEFTYHVMYHRCTGLYLTYPLMVHQQHVPTAYFDKRPRFSVEELKKNGAIGVRALDVLDGNVDSLPPPMDGMRWPYYDEWIPARYAQPPYTVPCITWMIALDPKDPRDILNLTTIPDMRFTLEMDTYLRTFHDKLTVTGGAVCQLTLFCNDAPMDQTVLTVDKELNVRSTVDLDIRKQYHLRLSFGTRYQMFSEAAIRSMQLHPYAALQCFQSMVPRLGVDWAKRNLLDGQYLPKPYIQWFYQYLADHGAGSVPGETVPSGPGWQGGGNDPGSSGGSNWNNDNEMTDDTDLDDLLKSGNTGGRYVQFLAIVVKREPKS